MFLVTSKEMNRIDRYAIDFFKIPERILMENAGRSASQFFLERFQNNFFRQVGILAGWGNNGGDAFVIARYLSQKNIPVTVFLLSKKSKVKSKSASENLDLIIALGISVIEVYDINIFEKIKFKFEACEVWIDSIFGTGLNSCIKGFIEKVIKFVNNMEKPIVAVDIPSGLNSDTGQICGVCINACATVTFSFAKIGHFLYPGAKYIGKLKVVDIGIPFLATKCVSFSHQLIDFNSDNIGSIFSSRVDDAHKGITGHLIVIAGSIGKTGAAVMTSLAAMRSGAGLVTLCVPESLNNIVESMSMEVINVGLPENYLGDIDITAFEIVLNLLKKKKCIVFGPGVGNSYGMSILLKKIITNCNIPIVIDADGLNLLSNFLDILREKKASIILTPHPGEMARLTGKSIIDVQKDRINIARTFAKKFNVHVILKGAGTVVAHPNKEVFINSTGNSGMASAGMGDVLAGMISAFITQGFPVDLSLRIAVYIHGLSGDSMASIKGSYGYLARDVIEQIPKEIGLISSKMSNL